MLPKRLERGPRDREYYARLHLILWWLADDASLSREARAMMRGSENALFVSSVSLCELWLKHSLGKLHFPSDFNRRLAFESFENLPLTAAHAGRVATLPWHHRDPFDRMLIAQAQEENLVLLTADKNIAKYGDAVLLV
jgi:PIN domain nuclease of toxin-antitoxin system